jgi:tRNA(Ile)-lysidine synthase
MGQLMPTHSPSLRTDLFQPGQRIAVGVSGGADSVALLLRLLEERATLGITLAVVHVNHGIRGTASENDATFVAGLAATHDLPFYLHCADASAAAAAQRETLEEAARNLRYAFFRQVLSEGKADAIVTAHTLDDQAETVLHKLLRGAWTEGLSGIHPVLAAEGATILRPFLQNTHAINRAWLTATQQPWREDETNQDMAYTRNRIRHQLLPLLRTFNPRITEQLARLAAISAAEEAYWQRELERLLPPLLLPGKPTRGGGRSISTRPQEETIAMEQERLRRLHPAVARRVLRAAARRLGSNLGFEHTERVLALLRPEKEHAAGRKAKFNLPGDLVVERSLREIRMTRSADTPPAPLPAYVFFIPGEVHAPEYGLNLQAERVAAPSAEVQRATLRAWRAGDRVTLRHSRGPKKVAEVLDRIHLAGRDRIGWPVVEWDGTIVWMRGVEVDAPDLRFTVGFLPPETGK